jgi:hypothetical protein
MPIIDATETVLIEVTKRDVNSELAERQSPSSCLLARACKRDMEAVQVRVHLTRIYVLKDKQWHRFIASRNLETEIVVFDRGGDFQPGQYLLRRPQKSQQLGAARAAPRKPRKSGPHKSPYLPRHVFENVRVRPGAKE